MPYALRVTGGDGYQALIRDDEAGDQISTYPTAERAEQMAHRWRVAYEGEGLKVEVVPAPPAEGAR